MKHNMSKIIRQIRLKQLKKLTLKNAFLLTGTPLENNIGDLWSLMDIANNNYLEILNHLSIFIMNQNIKPF